MILENNKEKSSSYDDITQLSLSASGKIWRYRKKHEERISKIAHHYEVSPFIATLLSYKEELDIHAIESFIYPKIKNLMPPVEKVKDMVEAANLIWQAYDKKSKIGVFGDYDVDGVTSVALLVSYFVAVDMDIPYVYIPDRVYEGYGLNREAITQCIAQKIALLIVVDCGSNDAELIDYAHENGITVIILDHHIITKENPAQAFINPKRCEDTSGLEDLCAAGLVFVLLASLNFVYTQRQTSGEPIKLPDVRQYLDLVCLATVADVVSLRGLNRAFVKVGLKVLEMQDNPALKYMLYSMNMDNKTVTTRDIGFKIAPLLNAAGRMSSARHALDFLLARDRQDIEQKLSCLVHHNKLRQETYHHIIEEATAKLLFDPPVEKSIFLEQRGWHKGVIGTVASYFVNQYDLPCFVISWQDNDIGSGSVRSVEGVDIGILLDEARKEECILTGGGHRMAGGFTLHKNQYDSFKNMLNHRINAMFAHMPMTSKEVLIDMVLDVNALTLDLYESLTLIEPFGKDNPPPLIMLKDVEVMYAKIVGKKHISCYIKQGTIRMIKAIMFNSADTLAGNCLMQAQIHNVSLIGWLEKDVWKNKEKVIFHIQDVMSS